MPIFLYVQLVPAVSFGDRVAGDVVFLSLYDSIGRERGYSKRHDTRTRIPNAHFAPLPDAGVKEFEIFNHFCVFLSEHSKSAGCSDLAALHVQGILGTGLFFLSLRPPWQAIGQRTHGKRAYGLPLLFVGSVPAVVSLCTFSFFLCSFADGGKRDSNHQSFFSVSKKSGANHRGTKKGCDGTASRWMHVLFCLLEKKNREKNQRGKSRGGKKGRSGQKSQKAISIKRGHP